MERYVFPKAPFHKAEVHEFISALQAELKDAEVSGENVDRLRREQETRINEYAASLSPAEATEFLLMCSVERLFLQTDEPSEPFVEPIEVPTNRVVSLIKLVTHPMAPTVIGISIGVVLVILIVIRIYGFVSS
ncbi:MAG: hypothetical protein ACWGSQ_08920 [Longimicrobiales bacterium]